MKVFVVLLLLSCCTGWGRLAAQSSARHHEPVAKNDICSLFPPTEGVGLDENSLLAAYNAQVTRIQSLHAVALLRAKSGKEYGIGDKTREIPAILDFVKPDMIRMTGVLPFASSRGFELASDGQVFRLLVPEEGTKTFLMGPVDAPSHSKKPRENLRPQPLLDALRWQEATARPGAKLAQVARTGFWTIEVNLPPIRGGAMTGQIEFDLRNGVVRSLSTRDAAGHPVSELSYREWTPMSTYPEDVPIGCFPRRIQLVERLEDFELSVHVTDIAFNPKVSKSIFRPSAPHGIPVVMIDMAGQTKQNE